jgi:hypothetical protein
MLKVIGAGLSRTGTLSLHHALEALGLRCIHFDDKRLNDIVEGANQNPDFRRYDDVDAVADLPAAFFYRELMQVYPECKVVLTIRDADAWWRSISAHFSLYAVREPRLRHYIGRKFGIKAWQEGDYHLFRRRLRHLAYGAEQPSEFLYKKRFREHNEQVKAVVPPERLLVMDVSAGDGWNKLCPFLGLPVRSEPFPHEHRHDKQQML